MKRTLVLALCLLMLVQLCACGRLDRLKNVELPPLPQVTERPEAPAETPAGNEEQQPAETAEETPAPEQPFAESLRQNVVVNFRKTEMVEYDPAEGEQKILTFSYVTPHVAIEGREAAADAINEYIAMLDEGFYTGNDYGDGASIGYYGMLEQAEDNFTYVREMQTDLPLEFACERGAGLNRADGRVLSLTMSTYTYSGGAHGMNVSRAYVFDTETGEIVSFDQLSADSAALRAFLTQHMVEMSETDETIREATADFVLPEEREARFGALLRDGSWYLTEDELVVFSDLYEISSYAAGMQFFRFPFAELGDLLDPRWRGAPESGVGSFSIRSTEDVENGSIPVLDMLKLDETGEQICLLSGERSCDVLLSRVAYAEYSGSFYLTDPLWYCARMESSAVQIQAEIPDGFPNLALSYRGENGEVHRCLISQSGEDGRLLLMEEGVSFLD